MATERKGIPWWIWRGLIALTVISALLIWLCIGILSSAERTSINIITIIGTVLGVVGIALAIYQQIQLISVSSAIEITTKGIENKVKDIHYEINVLNGIKCLDKIESYLTTDSDSKRVHIKLDDLHSCIISVRRY